MVTSLDRPVGEEEETTLGALLASEGRRPEEEVELAVPAMPLLHRALERLPEAERKVVSFAYGIGGDEPTPLREAAGGWDLLGRRAQARAQGAGRARRERRARAAQPAA